MTGWQPIETAPQDGQSCLIINDRGQFVARWDAGWCGHEGWWLVSDGKNDEHALRGCPPTHWMPLPPAPSAAA